MVAIRSVTNLAPGILKGYCLKDPRRTRHNLEWSPEGGPVKQKTKVVNDYVFSTPFHPPLGMYCLRSFNRYLACPQAETTSSFEGEIRVAQRTLAHVPSMAAAQH